MAGRGAGGVAASVGRVLLGGPLDPQVLEDAKRSTLAEVDDPLRQYSSFFLRLVIAAVIATAGVAADSTATVIGAMLVAPLMSPMLGTALSVSLARPRSALRTLAITLFGMALVVAVSVGVTAVIPVGVDVGTNSQVLSRVSPKIVDLVIALASGFMAALASMRRDIPDTLPGVAISASIVPPLCVVGAALFEGAPDAAAGAFLLFVTNYVAIQVAGGAVYLLMGLGSRRFSEAEEEARAVWYVTVAVVAAVVVALLSASSASVASRAARLRTVRDVAAAWSAEAGFRVSSLELSGDELFLQIAGPGSAPAAESLGERLREEGVALEAVSLSVVEESRVTY